MVIFIQEVGTFPEFVQTESIKDNVILKNKNVPGPCSQAFFNAGHMGFIDTLLVIREMLLSDDEFNPVLQTDCLKLSSGVFTAVRPAGKRNTENRVEKIPRFVLVA